MSTSDDPDSDAPDAYRALALQATCHAVHGASTPEEARSRIQENVDRLGRQIRASNAFIGADCRLVVLPEYVLTGFPMGEGIEEWREKAAIAMGGPAVEALGRIAQTNDVFLAVNAYEREAHFPDLYFQTSFVLDPSGDVVLRYRRLNSMYAPTPHDVWDRYLDHYGLDGVFPVADTEIGRLAAIASEEILYPEIARCHLMRGAEVFVHSTSEPYGDEQAPKDTAKRARAQENMAYVVSANTAGIEGTAIPAASTDGGSKVVGYDGRVLTEAGPGESMAAYATVDLAALRRERQRPSMQNLVARQRFECYAESYAQTQFYPANTVDGAPARSHFVDTQKKAIERLREAGVI
jgi:predicted amidohydrolase